MSDTAVISGLELYLVRNQQGQWFRAKGRDGSGNSWVDDINKARVYARLSTARACVSFFASKWPAFGRPQIVKLQINGYQVLDEQARVDQVVEKKRKARERSDVEHKKWQLKEAELALAEAKERYAEASKD